MSALHQSCVMGDSRTCEPPLSCWPQPPPSLLACCHIEGCQNGNSPCCKDHKETPVKACTTIAAARTFHPQQERGRASADSAAGRGSCLLRTHAWVVNSAARLHCLIIAFSLISLTVFITKPGLGKRIGDTLKPTVLSVPQKENIFLVMYFMGIWGISSWPETVLQCVLFVKKTFD